MRAGSTTTRRWSSAGSRSDDCQTPEGARLALEGVDAVLIPGGFGVRGIEGKLGALRWARENLVPTLGICLGLQCMVIEYSRTVLGLDGASSSEFDDDPAHPVIATMAEQRAFVGGAGDLGGTMRLGAYDALLTPGSVDRRDLRRDQGLRASPPPVRGQQRLSRRAHQQRIGDLRDFAQSGRLVEMVELPTISTRISWAAQFHPEFKSRPQSPHPLFAGLVGAALALRGDES